MRLANIRASNVGASIAAAAATLVTSPVRGEDAAATRDAIESAPAAEPTESPPERWYGWQTLIVDSVAAGAFAAGVAQHIDPLSVTGMILYGARPPVVHGLHGHPWLALGDVALRAAAPVVLALIGVAIEDAATPRQDSRAPIR